MNVVFQDFFFLSGNNINPKHEFEGNKSKAEVVEAQLQLYRVKWFFLVVSSETGGESFN